MYTARKWRTSWRRAPSACCRAGCAIRCRSSELLEGVEMTRRDILRTAGSASALFTMEHAIGQTMPLKNLGVAPAGLPVRSRAGRGGAVKFDYVEHCHSLGVGVVEMRAIAPEEAQAFRKKMEAYHMRAIGNVPLPRDVAAVPAFEAGIKASKEA